MKVFACITPAHRVLLEEEFKPTLPKGFDLEVFEIDLEGSGDFYSDEFLECIRRKVRLIVQTIEQNQGDYILWSDVDIVFLEDCTVELLKLAQSADVDLLLQQEGKMTQDFNAGFIVIHCNERSLKFYEKLDELLAASSGVNEQTMMNRIFADPKEYGLEIKVAGLPLNYYARTHGWPPPSDLRVYHANYTLGEDGIGQKQKQFKELRFIRKYGMAAVLLSCLKRVPGKLMKSLKVKNNK